jgi:hypothetical protein
MTVTTFAARTCLLLALPALALACTLPTKLGELSDESGGEATEPVTTTGDEPTTAGSAPPINDDTSGGDETSSGGSSSGGVGCTAVKLTRTPVSPNVVLVLDKSGSMVAEQGGLWDHDDDPNTATVSRWSSLHEVVETIATDFEDKINLGAHLYPSVDAIAAYNEMACVVDGTINVAVAAANKDAILAGIPDANDLTLRGGTPVASAMTVALDHLKTLDPGVPRAVLLVTDGAANCGAGAMAPELFEVYDEDVHTIVDDAFTVDGIPTYVVGVGIADDTTDVVQDGNPDDTNAFDRLNDLAEQGGKPRDDPSERFFNTANQIELAAALDQIALDALTCILPLDPAPVDPESTVVVLDGSPVPHVSDCQTETGWVYTNPEGPFDAIRMCGSACSGLKLTGSAELTVCAVD